MRFRIRRLSRFQRSLCKWLVVVAMWAAGFYGLKMTDNMKNVYSTVMENGDKYDNYHVMLNSYMRSGSTLTGIVLGFRQDAFYVYEPLWKMSRWAYWRGNNSACRMDRLECIQVAPDQILDADFVYNKNIYPPGSLRMALATLRKIYRCEFGDFYQKVVDEKLTVSLGGPSWEEVNNCFEESESTKWQQECVAKSIPRICRKSRHVVTKVLRMTVDNLEIFLEWINNLKIVHLFRDPRAILNSRIQTDWYPTKTDKQIIDNARSLCDKIIIDYKEGQRLLEKHPSRFIFVYYEDLNNEPLYKVKVLYKYFKMDLNEEKYETVRQLPVFNADDKKTEREKNTAFWWRKTLEWDLVTQIDDVCSDVYTILGYRRFRSEEEMRDLTIDSVTIPYEYLLK